MQHHIFKFHLCINDPNLIGISTHIRLQQLQNNLWSTTNILQHPHPYIDGPNKNTTTYKIIQLFNKLQITLQANSNILRPYTL
jgi:alpha/beta superfamily hydrolase